MEPLGDLLFTYGTYAVRLFWGLKQSSGELYVASEEGGLRTVRSARRIPVEDRWDARCLEWVKMVPWNLGREDKRADGEIPEVVKSGPAREVTEEEIEALKTRATSKYPEFKIMQEHCDRFGYTSGCPGCSSRLRGLSRQPHNKECRERFEKLMQADAFLANEEAQTAGQKRRSEDGEEVEAKRTYR